MAAINVHIISNSEDKGGCKKPNDDTPKAMQILFNLSYRFWVSPFRVSRDTSGRYSLEVTRTRKVVCIILHSSVVLYQITAFFYTTRMGLKSGDPKFIFNTAFNVTSHCMTFSVVHTLWYGRGFVEKFMNECHHQNGTGNCLPIPWWLNPLQIATAIGTLLSSLLFVFMTIPTATGEFGSALEVFGVAGTPRLNNNQTFDSHGNLWLDLFTEAEYMSSKVALVLFFFLRMNVYLIGGFGFVMLFVNSAEMYRIAARLHNSACATNGDKYDLMQEYRKARENIALLNKAASLPLLFNATQFVLFSSLQLPGLLQDSTPPTSLGMVLDHSVASIIASLLAAEGNWMMCEVKSVIISRFNLSESANVATSLANLPGEDGLSGGKFFVVSYDFLGSVVTAIFTFVLVVQQLKVP